MYVEAIMLKYEMEIFLSYFKVIPTTYISVMSNDIKSIYIFCYLTYKHQDVMENSIRELLIST